eukprot:TRINITY_DN14205_c0_g1_i1.p1 TRINITY_DN14205_c0_g1~~TRINITY_DN14205_c0_g1_i1.p1  ORF type:complete len:279 (+),score=29.03 TRINITY_DN14205_c0_g1_i1:216-1052(+)
MPHILIERVRSFNLLAYVTGSEGKIADYARRYSIEVIDVTACMTFLLGSICFLPQFSHNLQVFLLGCALFVVGGVISTLLSLCSALEALHKSEEEEPDFLEVSEHCLYVVGSVVFTIGTILYWPDEAAQIHWTLNAEWFKDMSLGHYFNLMSPEFEGTVLFIIGSLLYAAAAFINGLNHTDMVTYQGKCHSASTTMYMSGSLLFVMGSVAFLPHLGCNEQMIAIGAWSFIIGSVFFVIGSVISFHREHLKIQNDENASLVEEEKGYGKDDAFLQNVPA